MHLSVSRGRLERKSRKGLSLFEFIACLVALIGGVTLGSMYLGIDLKRVVLESLANGGGTDGSAAEGGQQVASSPSHQDQPSREKNQPESQPDSAAALEVSDDPSVEAISEDSPSSTASVAAPSESATEPLERKPEFSAPAAPQSPLPGSHFSNWVASLNQESLLTEEQRTALTVAYWQALTECIDLEATSRDAILKELETLQLFDYLSHRQAQHRLSANKIAELSRFGIDPHVSAFGAKVHRWQEAGATLYARALSLLTDAPTSQLTGPFAQSWQSAATQHRMEERLLLEKRKALDNYILHLKDGDAAAVVAD